MKLGRNLLPTLVVGSLLFSANILAQEVYRARLSPMPTTPQTVTTILGEGEVILTLNDNSLTVEGNFSGMSSAATGAHIHNGPPAQPGPVIHTLEVSQSTDGSVNGTLSLSEEQIEALSKNEFYIQIHSESNPAGELRGWVFLRSHFSDLQNRIIPMVIPQELQLIRHFLFGLFATSLIACSDNSNLHPTTRNHHRQIGGSFNTDL